MARLDPYLPKIFDHYYQMYNLNSISRIDSTDKVNLDKNEDNLPIQKLTFESFFVYFAIQQRQKLSKKALEAQLKTNPHPPDKYRCNVPLSRLPVFRAIFDIKKGDKMWWHSTNRVWED